MGPLILTLELDDETSRELTAWRTRFFPPDRNFLSAHVTFFHALPGDKSKAIEETLRAECTKVASFDVRIRAPYSLGRGVALEVEAPEIRRLRNRLRELWLPDLGPQDRVEKIRPHVTIQNKVSGDVARDTLAEVRATWNPETRGRALGLGLWEYRNGPWDFVATHPFTSVANSSC